MRVFFSQITQARKILQIVEDNSARFSSEIIAQLISDIPNVAEVINHLTSCIEYKNRMAIPSAIMNPQLHDCYGKIEEIKKGLDNYLHQFKQYY